MNDNLQNLYNTLRSDYGDHFSIDFEQFASDMKDAGKRNRLYETMRNDYGSNFTKSFDEFSGDIGFGQDYNGTDVPKNAAQKQKGFWHTGVGDTLEKLGAGTLNTIGGLVKVQEATNPFTYVSRYVNNKVLKREPMKDISDYLFEGGETLSERGDRFGFTEDEKTGEIRKKNYKDLWKEGKYWGAVGDVMLNATESAPTSALAMVPVVGLGLTGASAAGQKYYQLDNDPETKDLPEWKKILNATVSGAIEGLTEKGGALVDKKMIEPFLKKMTESTVKKILKKGGINALLQTVTEGIEEFFSQVGGNVTDYATSVSKEFKPWEGVLDATVYGAGGGAQFGGVTMGAAGYRAAQKANLNRKNNRINGKLESINNEIKAKQNDIVENVVNPVLPEGIDLSNPDVFAGARMGIMNAKREMDAALKGSNFTFDDQLLSAGVEEQKAVVRDVFQDDALTTEQKRRILNYISASGAERQLQIAREEQVRQEIELMRKDTQSRINPTSGTLVLVKIKGTEGNPVSIKSGLAIRPVEDGSSEGTSYRKDFQFQDGNVYTVDEEHSDEEVYYIDDNESTQVTTADALELVSSMDAQMVMEQNEKNILLREEEFFTGVEKAVSDETNREESGSRKFEMGDIAELPDGSLTQIMDIYDDGSIALEIEHPDGTIEEAKASANELGKFGFDVSEKETFGTETGSFGTETSGNVSIDERKADEEKAAFMKSLPVIESGKDAGEYDQIRFTPEQNVKFFEYEYGKDAALEAAEKKVEILKKNITKETQKLDNDPFNINQKRKVAEMQKELKAYSDYVFSEKQSRTEQRISESATSSVLDAKEQRREAIHQEKAGRTGTASEYITERWNKSQKFEGISDVITLANGEKITGKYVLTSASALSPSHNVFANFTKTDGFPTNEHGKTVNDRDYEADQTAQVLVQQRANNYDERAVQTPVVVSNEGIVLSGNDRTMSGQLAAKQGTDGAYNSYIRQYADRWGFSQEQIDAVENPRIVFVPEQTMPYNTATFAKFNAEEKKTQNSLESAIKASKSISRETIIPLAGVIEQFEKLNDYYNNIAAAKRTIEILTGNGIIGTNEIPKMVDGSVLSQEGRSFLETLMLGSVLNEEALRQVDKMRSVRQTLMRSMPQLLRNAALKDYSLVDELNNAISLLYSAKQNGSVVKLQLLQGNLFEASAEEIYSEAEKLLALMLENEKDTEFRRIFEVYNTRAVDIESGQADMFEGLLTKPELLQKILDNYGQQEKSIEQVRSASAVDRRGEESETERGESGTTEVGGEKTGRESGREEVERGFFGTIYRQFKGKAKEAIAFLIDKKEGEAVGALYHPEVGDIDLVWGEEGTSASDGYGLSKIVKYHPEVLDNLQEIINDMAVVAKTDNRIQLESDTHKAAVRLEWNKSSKKWLLTAFKKETPASTISSTDVESNRNGLRNDTATPQNASVSDTKDNTEKQKSQKNGDILSVANNAVKNAEIKKEGEKVNQSPSEAQKEAGNYKKGHVSVQGFDITIENPKGSVRRGVDEDGKAWETTMQNHYGYFKRTEGKDGDHIDVFIGDNPLSEKIFVVDQNNPQTGIFDESKVMFGFTSADEARNAYMSNYEPDWKGFGSITETTVEDFKKWLYDGAKQRKAFSEYKDNGINKWTDKYNKFISELADELQSDAAENGDILSREDAILMAKENSETNEESNLYIEAEKRIAEILSEDQLKEFESEEVTLHRMIEKLSDLDTFNFKNKDKLSDSEINKSNNELNKKEQEPESLQESKPTESGVGQKGESNIQAKRSSVVPNERIEDFGEKIGGARKDLAQEYKKKLSEIKEDDIRSKPLSKIFPRLNFKALVENGDLTVDDALFLNYMYDKIPKKPRDRDTDGLYQKRKLDKWLKEVQKNIDMAEMILSQEESFDHLGMLKKMKQQENAGYRYYKNGEEIQVTPEQRLMLNDDLMHIEALKALGFPTSGIKMGNAKLQYRVHSGEQFIVTVNNKRSVFETFEDAVDYLKNELENPTKRETVFNVYQNRKSGKYFIGKPVQGKNPIQLSELFDTEKEVRAYLRDHRDEVQRKWDAMNVKPEERRSENHERKGRDWRNGKDVSPEQFQQEFGFRGTEFGNWVNQQERQDALNNAYDALMDLASVLDISPRALSLNGELAMAFGARGDGNAGGSTAVAHYEPNKVVINLTKKSGAGSLGHEWWHALDNYFARIGGGAVTYSTEGARRLSDNMRQEMKQAFDDVMSAIKKSELPERSEELDKTRSKPYWSSNVEMSARSFENYINTILAEKGDSNDYLVNFKDLDVWITSGAFEGDTYPYPTKEESHDINEKFQQFFNTIQEKTDESGNVALYQLSENDGAPKAIEKQVSAVVDQLKKSGLPGEVVTVGTTAEAKKFIDGRKATVRRQLAESKEIERANEEFNENVDKAINDELPANKILSLGRPSNVLLAAGLSDKEIVLTQGVLRRHIKKHGLSAKDLHNLVINIRKPVMVYSWGEKAQSFVVITDLQAEDGRKITTAIKIDRGRAEVNEIASIHGKDIERLIRDINTDKSEFGKENLKYVNKEKTLHWFAQFSPKENSTTNERLSATKIVQDFENPSVSDENLCQAVWHGGPNKFKSFDFSHMGRGEGNQAYGWGGYVTEVEGIGRTYAEKNIPDKYRENRTINEIAREAIEYSVSKEAALGYLYDMLNKSWTDKKRIKAAIRIIETGKFLPEGEHYLYEIEIPDDNGTNYLYWEKPLTEDTSLRIKQALLEKGFSKIDSNWDTYEKDGKRIVINPNVKGSDIYYEISDALSSDKAASKFLSSSGFTGISYPAQFLSGGREDGKRNYVIFNEKDMKIIDRTQWALSPNGEIAGATLPDGTVILVSDNMTIDTPFHEFAHKLRKYAKAHPEFSNLVAAIDKYSAGAPQHIKDYVKRTYRYKTESEAYMDESYAWALSMQSKDKLIEFLKERGVDTSNITGLAETQAWYSKLWDTVKRLWDGVKSYFAKDSGTEYADLSVFDAYEKMSAQEIGDKLYDLLMGGKQLPNFDNTKQDAELQNYAEQYAVEGDVDANGNVRSEVLEEIRKEREEIKEKARAGGTFMKAPNGEPTKLNEDQWVTVRTNRFKKWFGDWELKYKSIKLVKAESKHGFANLSEAEKWAKENISRVYSDEETGGKGEIHISNNAIKKYLSKLSVEKSDSVDIHLSVLRELPSVIKHSVDAEQHPDYTKGANGERTSENEINKDAFIHRLYGAVNVDGKIYRVKITLKELLYGDIPNVPYSYEATKIELLAGLPGSTNESTLPRYSNNSITATNLLQGVEKSYEKGKYLLDDHSKVVDESGEPLVIAHSTNKDFYEFTNTQENDAGWLGKGFYFFGDRSLDGQYGKNVIEVFANVRNPYYLSEDEHNDLVEHNDKDYSAEFTENIEGNGYDAVNYNGDLNQEWNIFESNQIKSATDNVGTFDAGNDDIRYRKEDDRTGSVSYGQRFSGINGYVNKEEFFQAIERFDNPLSADDKYRAANELVSMIERLFNPICKISVVRDRNQLIEKLRSINGENRLIINDLEKSRDNPLQGFYYNGRLYLNVEDNLDSKELLQTFIHESCHEYNNYNKEKVISLSEKLDDALINSVLPNLYHKYSKVSRTDEFVAFLAEEALNDVSLPQLGAEHDEVIDLITNFLNTITDGRFGKSDIGRRFRGERGQSTRENIAGGVRESIGDNGERAVSHNSSTADGNHISSQEGDSGSRLRNVDNNIKKPEYKGQSIFAFSRDTALFNDRNDAKNSVNLTSIPKPPVLNATMSLQEVADAVTLFKQQTDEVFKDVNREMGKISSHYTAFVDRARPLEKLLQLMKEKGAKIDSSTDAYMDYISSASRATHLIQEYEKTRIEPLQETLRGVVKRLKASDAVGDYRWHVIDEITGDIINDGKITEYDRVSLYLQAKDIVEADGLKGVAARGSEGFENNVRDAFGNGVKPSDYIAEFEKVIGLQTIDDIWTKVRAVNKWALDLQYKYGLIGRDVYDEYSKGPRKFYVPQRGWRERDLNDSKLYYVTSKDETPDNPYNAALIKAKGRQTLAGDPLAYMQSIGESSVMAAMKNRTKQKFLQFAEDNADFARTHDFFGFKRVYYLATGKHDADGNMTYERSYTPPSDVVLENDKQVLKAIKDLSVQRTLVQDNYRAGKISGAAFKRMMTRMADKEKAFRNNIQVKYTDSEAQRIAQVTAKERGQHSVIILKDGKEYEIVFSKHYGGERVANILNRNFGKEVDGDLKFMQSVNENLRRGTRFMSALMTQYNPTFAVSNAIRDYGTASISNIVEHGIGYQMRFNKNIAAVQRTVWRYAAADQFETGKEFRSADKADKYDVYIKEFLEDGAATGWSFLKDIETLRRDMRRAIDPKTRDYLLHGKMGIYNAFGLKQVFGMLTEVSELTTRLATYVTSREEKKTDGTQKFTREEAAMHAKEVSVNFDRKGNQKFFGTLFSFFNANIQGTNKIFRMIRNKKVRTALASTSAMLFAGGLLQALLMPDPDDDDERMFTEWELMNNVCIGKVKFPLPQGFRAFWGVGAQAGLAGRGTKSAAESVIDGTKYFFGELIPEQLVFWMNGIEIDNKTERLTYNPTLAVRGAVPTTLQPMYDVWQNTNFMGGTSYRTEFTNATQNTKAERIMGKRNVSEAAQYISDWLWVLGGGDVADGSRLKKADTGVVASVFNVNPSVIETLTRGYAAGTGKFVMDMYSLAYQILDPEKKIDVSRMAIANVLWKQPREYSALDSKLWTLRDKTDFYKTQFSDIKKNNPERYRRIVSFHTGENRDLLKYDREEFNRRLARYGTRENRMFDLVERSKLLQKQIEAGAVGGSAAKQQVEVLLEEFRELQK